MNLEKVAHLARLSLTEEEKGHLTKQLESILEFVQQLQEVNTEHVEPLLPAFEETPLREDEPVRDFDPTNLLKHAPQSEGPFFVVPRVVE
ncbi:MAG: Asp-tRNA(Asn)/Glu-tRNA(Gln) amidotransferase subunit GatC [Aquificaceae bacterium]|nr:Asp-tRNA(Asn)/Glu-tRNA(Gln) amidotransferase subunit GatC [Aquificaceae bacterium]MCX8060564.1 Asp-tRNA(Asn)/Glu-tRNA(Gln) amidotransferase subunit GatC [Aquificaceae bacterium]MDW8097025.1 Asp-tRNA(Asn)/Glu-tRNA(Gln) amidotransferase subunit GatC [Aquificaceae bacterium]